MVYGGPLPDNYQNFTRIFYDYPYCALIKAGKVIVIKRGATIITCAEQQRPYGTIAGKVKKIRKDVCKERWNFNMSFGDVYNALTLLSFPTLAPELL